MKVLEIIAHCNPQEDSSSHKLAFAARDALTSAGHEVQVIDLLKDNLTTFPTRDDFIDKAATTKEFDYFGTGANPDNLIPEIREQQKKLLWADYLIIYAPIWWYNLPGCLNNYFDRVFTLNFAFDASKQREQLPLAGKKAMIVITSGSPESEYSFNGSIASIEGLLYNYTYTLYHIGFDVLRSQGFCRFSPRHPVTPDLIEKFQKAILNIAKRPLLNFVPQGDIQNNLRLLADLPNYTLDEAVIA